MTDIHPSPHPVAAPGCPAHPDAVPLAGLEYQQTPSELYRGLRAEHGAVAPVLLDGDIPAWLVLGYPEVSYVTSHDELFARDSRRWNQWGGIPPDWPLLPYVGHQPSVLFTEGEEHRRRAGVITQALAGIDQFELARDCRQLAGRLIAAFAGSGRAELMRGYAHPLPMRAAVRMCGMPHTGAETQQLVEDLRVSLDAAEGDDPVAAYTRVGERIHRLVRHKRERPGPDVTSRMLTHPAGLTDEEVVQDLISVNRRRPAAHRQLDRQHPAAAAHRRTLRPERLRRPSQRGGGPQRGAVAGHPHAELHRPLGRQRHPAGRSADPRR
ncbi:cytochrome P450 [Streptomyces sp. SAI-195]